MLQWFTGDHILALIAIVFGVVGIYYERKLHTRFKSHKLAIDMSFAAQKEKIEQIVLSVHTSYIGKFPIDLQKTTELISNSKDGDEVMILTDFLAYGHYSDPDAYDKYVQALTGAKARIQMLVYDEDAAKMTLQMQFRLSEFDNIKKSEAFKRYLEYYKKLIKVVPSRYEEFLNMLIIVQDHFCQHLTGKLHIDVRAVSSTAIKDAMLFWMVGKKEMVFAFPNAYTGRKDFSFRTRDDHLMEIFIDQFKSKWEQAQPIEGKCYKSAKLFDDSDVLQEPIVTAATAAKNA